MQVRDIFSKLSGRLSQKGSQVWIRESHKSWEGALLISNYVNFIFFSPFSSRSSRWVSCTPRLPRNTKRMQRCISKLLLRQDLCLIIIFCQQFNFLSKCLLFMEMVIHSSSICMIPFIYKRPILLTIIKWNLLNFLILATQKFRQYYLELDFWVGKHKFGQCIVA